MRSSYAEGLKSRRKHLRTVIDSNEKSLPKK